MSKYKIQTYTGKLVDYLEPDPETICIEDIAKALSLEPRFAGQTKRHYSVALHSIMVCGMAPKQFKLEALLHDAEEAYIKDIPTPLVDCISRGQVSQFRYIKKKIRKAIFEKFGLYITPEEYKQIKEIDMRMALTEASNLFNAKAFYQFKEIFTAFNDYQPYDILLYPKPLIEIEQDFLSMFELYRRDKSDA
jgi:5'-deoxynucleotidase YfbR-like HD superfamily hydrolase